MTGSTHFDLENEALETTTLFTRSRPSDESADMNVADKEEEEVVIHPPTLTTSSPTLPFLNPPPRALKAEAVSRNRLIVTFSVPVVGPSACNNAAQTVVGKKRKTPRQIDFETIQNSTLIQNGFISTSCCHQLFREPPLLIGKAVWAYKLVF